MLKATTIKRFYKNASPKTVLRALYTVFENRIYMWSGFMAARMPQGCKIADITAAIGIEPEYNAGFKPEQYQTGGTEAGVISADTVKAEVKRRKAINRPKKGACGFEEANRLYKSRMLALFPGKKPVFYNLEYLADIFAVSGEKKLTAYTNGATGAIILRNESGEFIGVLMPVKSSMEEYGRVMEELKRLENAQSETEKAEEETAMLTIGMKVVYLGYTYTVKEINENLGVVSMVCENPNTFGFDRKKMEAGVELFDLAKVQRLAKVIEEPTAEEPTAEEQPTEEELAAYREKCGDHIRKTYKDSTLRQLYEQMKGKPAEEVRPRVVWKSMGYVAKAGEKPIMLTFGKLNPMKYFERSQVESLAEAAEKSAPTPTAAPAPAPTTVEKLTAEEIFKQHFSAKKAAKGNKHGNGHAVNLPIIDKDGGKHKVTFLTLGRYGKQVKVDGDFMPASRFDAAGYTMAAEKIAATPEETAPAPAPTPAPAPAEETAPAPAKPTVPEIDPMGWREKMPAITINGKVYDYSEEVQQELSEKWVKMKEAEIAAQGDEIEYFADVNASGYGYCVEIVKKTEKCGFFRRWNKYANEPSEVIRKKLTEDGEYYYPTSYGHNMAANTKKAKSLKLAYEYEVALAEWGDYSYKMKEHLQRELNSAVFHEIYYAGSGK